MQSRVFRLCLDLRSSVAGSLIRRVIHAVMPADWFKVPRVHAFYATHVHAVLVWIGSALMMRIDTADFAEIVLRCVGSKTVKRQVAVAFDDPQIRARHTGGRGPPTPAIGTVAPPRCAKSVFQMHGKFNRAAMARDLDRATHFRRTDGTRDRESWYLASGCGGWPSVRVQNCGPPKRSQSGMVSANPITNPPTWAQ